MGILQKLKSALGLDGASSDTNRSGDVDVTVEREPSTADEDAVKGTDTSTSNAASTADTDDAGAPSTSDEVNEATDVEEATDIEGSTDPVTELNGIGPAYAERLSGQDIETVGELAVADPDAVAAETDLGATRVANWVEQAREY
jgi:predicted flap endonuclease-1-like 5' DNA nuclease